MVKTEGIQRASLSQGHLGVNEKPIVLKATDDHHLFKHIQKLISLEQQIFDTKLHVSEEAH